MRVVNDLVIAADSETSSILVVLDLSDTICHSVLLNRLSSLLGLSGTALAWFQSYLTNLVC